MPTYVLESSPVGPLTLVADHDGRLCKLSFGREAEGADDAQPTGVIAETLRQLDEYFAGTRRDFDLALAPHGTVFQLAAWDALQTIPYGETRSYGDMARTIGRPKAVRAVGQANNRNPIAIIIPCHRVIGSDHSLTGYGGGLDNKRFLLALEGATLTPALDL